MPLIVSDILRRGYSSLRPDVSSIYIVVDAKYLSQAYDLWSVKSDIWVSGSILGLEKISGSLSAEEERVIREHIANKEARFYLITGFLTSKDHLYLDEKTWSLLRDHGFLPEDYVIKARLEKIEIIDKTSGEKKQLSIYPYRSIEMQAR